MRSPLLTALLHPLNLAMLGLSLFALLFSAWWLFPVGLLFWAIMVLAIARNPSLRFNAAMQSREPLAQRFQRYFDRIERSQVGIFNTLSSAPPRTRRALQPLHSEVDALTRQVHSLCRRMTALENYRLVAQSQADLQGDLKHIEESISRTEDDLVRREYEESRDAMRGRLAKLERVSTQLERVEAQLLSLANEMDGTVTEVIRLQAMGPEDAANYMPALVKKLQGQRAELEAFEREAAGMPAGIR
jgi:chromosome segregation ATPase